MGPRVGLDAVTVPCQVPNPGRQTRSLVTLVTELRQFLTVTM